MSEPEYTKGKRRSERIQYSRDGRADTLIYVRDHRGRRGEVCVGGGVVDLGDRLYSDECEANARLSAASDNAVLELADHLGCNAVLLAERLEGGGLVRLVEALGPFAKAGELFGPRASDDYDQSIYSPAAGSEYSLCGDDLRRALAALSHLTTPAPR